MSLRTALFTSCLGLAFMCLAGGYLMTGAWTGAGAVLVPILALACYKKLAVAWLPPACLVCLAGLAAAGLLAGAPAFLMIPGATAALAAWDLLELDRTMASSEPSATARRFEKKHAQALALALGLGLLLAVSGRLFSIRIPFVLLILVILADLFSLDRISRYIRNKGAGPAAG